MFRLHISPPNRGNRCIQEEHGITKITRSKKRKKMSNPDSSKNLKFRKFTFYQSTLCTSSVVRNSSFMYMGILFPIEKNYNGRGINNL